MLQPAVSLWKAGSIHQVKGQSYHVLWPAYYMYDNVINSSHCYRFIMYFSNLILYVY